MLKKLVSFMSRLSAVALERSDQQWVDLDLYGHQIVAHYHPRPDTQSQHSNAVDGPRRSGSSFWRRAELGRVAGTCRPIIPGKISVLS